jgi:hypothetical protein
MIINPKLLKMFEEEKKLVGGTHIPASAPDLPHIRAGNIAGRHPLT